MRLALTVCYFTEHLFQIQQFVMGGGPERESDKRIVSVISTIIQYIYNLMLYIYCMIARCLWRYALSPHLPKNTQS